VYYFLWEAEYGRRAPVQYTQTLTASLTPAAAITNQTRKPLAASVTPAATTTRTRLVSLAASQSTSGLLIKQTRKPLVALLTPAASLVLRTGKALDASLTLSADLQRQLSRAISGVITPSAVLALQTQRPLAASLTLSASLQRRLARALTASLTPTATLGEIKVVLLSLTASLTPSATVRTQPRIALSASQATAADVLKQIGKGLAATQLSAADVLRFTSKGLSGSLTPSATILPERLAHTFPVSLTASLTPSASVGRGISRAVLASLTPGAELNTQQFLSFGPSQESHGALETEPRISLSASVTPTTNLGRKVFKGLAAVLMPIGDLGAVFLGFIPFWWVVESIDIEPAYVADAETQEEYTAEVAVGRARGVKGVRRVNAMSVSFVKNTWRTGQPNLVAVNWFRRRRVDETTTEGYRDEEENSGEVQVTMEVYDPDTETWSDVQGGSWPATLPYVSGSPGRYAAMIDSPGGVDANPRARYRFSFTGKNPSGSVVWRKNWPLVIVEQ
jgi:hypothetical protein